MTKVIPLEFGLLKQNLKNMKKNLNLAVDIWNQHQHKMSEKDKKEFIQILKDYSKNLKKYPHT